MRRVLSLSVFLFLIGLPSHGAIAGKDFARSRKFWIDGKPVRMIWSAGAEAWASPACGGGQKKSCGALNLLSLIRLDGLPVEKGALTGGRNPSTHLCKKLGGALILAKTDKKSDWFFCRAGDGSMISAAALGRVL